MDLPAEVIIDIFHYLPLTDILLGCALVCKRWNELAEAPELWRSIDRRDMKVVTTRKVQKLLEKSNSIRSINLRKCIGVHERIMTDIAKQTQLQTLSLKNCQQFSSQSLLYVRKISSLQKLYLCGINSLTDEVLDTITKGCTRLTNLNIGFCGRVTAAGLQSVFEYCTELKELSMKNCYSVTREFLNALRTDNRIETLDFRSCSGIDSIPELCWRKFTNLVSLNVDRIDVLDDKLVSALSNLKCLRLEGNRRVTNAGVLTILQNNPRLEWLNVRRCHIDDVAFESISKSPCRYTLKYLSIQNSKFITYTDRSFELITRNCTQLIAFKTDFGRETVMRIQARNPDMKFEFFEFCCCRFDLPNSRAQDVVVDTPRSFKLICCGGTWFVSLP